MGRLEVAAIVVAHTISVRRHRIRSDLDDRLGRGAESRLCSRCSKIPRSSLTHCDLGTLAYFFPCDPRDAGPCWSPGGGNWMARIPRPRPFSANKSQLYCDGPD